MIGIINYGASQVSHTGWNEIELIKQGNIYSVQFHPEKSGPAGLKLLSNWSLKC